MSAAQPTALLVPSTTTAELAARTVRPREIVFNADTDEYIGRGNNPLLDIRSARGVSLKGPLFNAVGDGVADDTFALLSAIIYMLANRVALYIPASVYKITQNVVLDLVSVYDVGCMIFGDGTELSVLDMTSVKTSPAFLVTCSRSPGDCFYPALVDFGIRGDLPGVVFQMGKDDYSDPINKPTFRLAVQNYDKTTASRAAITNHVLNADGVVEFNCGSGGITGGNGIAWTIRQMIMSRITGSVSSADTSILFDDGYSYGNVFSAMDMENVATCVDQTSAHSGYNTFHGGNFVYSRNAVQSTEPGAIIIDNAAPNPQGGATLADFVNPAKYLGIVLRGRSGTFFPPTLPASGVAVVNTTGQDADVLVGGGVTSVTIDQESFNVTAGQFFPVRAGASVTVAYTGDAYWSWNAR